MNRRTSAAGDVQVSMLPDLSEMRANEQTAWEEVMQLKALPIPMCQKKEMKAKILVSLKFNFSFLLLYKPYVLTCLVETYKWF